jgi:hypothetical protein
VTLLESVDVVAKVAERCRENRRNEKSSTANPGLLHHPYLYRTLSSRERGNSRSTLNGSFSGFSPLGEVDQMLQYLEGLAIEIEYEISSAPSSTSTILDNYESQVPELDPELAPKPEFDSFYLPVITFCFDGFASRCVETTSQSNK